MEDMLVQGDTTDSVLERFDEVLLQPGEPVGSVGVQAKASDS